MTERIYIPDKINDEYVKDDEMATKKMTLAELEGNPELTEFKKIVHDKNKEQFSIKLPKALALKAGVKPESNVAIVFNPHLEKTLEEMKKSRLVIYLKDEEDKPRRDNEEEKLFLSSVQNHLGDNNKKMYEVIAAISARGNTATAHEISEKSGISYITVQKYLEELEKKGLLLVEGKDSKVKRYSLNYDFKAKE